MNGESPSDDFVRAGQDAYAIAFANAMVAPSGLSEIVKAISERFHGNVAVCSNFIRADSIRIPLERDGIAPYLKGAVVSCEIGFIKPHPLIFQATINLLQESPEKIVHVGDDWDADVIGASRSGLKSVYTTQWRDENDPWYGKISCPIAEISELTRFIAL
jgi:putative hydrolase of the HAD superfamily